MHIYSFTCKNAAKSRTSKSQEFKTINAYFSCRLLDSSDLWYSLPGLDFRLWVEVMSDPFSSISSYSRYVIFMVQGKNTGTKSNHERTHKAFACFSLKTFYWLKGDLCISPRVLLVALSKKYYQWSEKLCSMYFIRRNRSHMMKDMGVYFLNIEKLQNLKY